MSINIQNLDLDIIGNPHKGRPTLGPETSILTYRIVRLLALEMVEQGQQTTDVYNTGEKIGKVIYEKLIENASSPDDFVVKVSALLEGLKIGILSIKEFKTDDLFIRLTIDECASCSGIPNNGEAVCHLEGGLIAGLIGTYLEKPVKAIETKCWGLGDQTCEFEITAK